MNGNSGGRYEPGRRIASTAARYTDMRAPLTWFGGAFFFGAGLRRVSGRSYSRRIAFCSLTPHLGHSTTRVQSSGGIRLPSLSVGCLGTLTYLMGTVAPQPPHRDSLELRAIL